MYLGEGIDCSRWTWDQSRSKKPMVFARNLAKLIFGTRTLVNRCLQLRKTSISITGRPPRREFSKEEKKLFISKFINTFIENIT